MPNNRYRVSARVEIVVVCEVSAQSKRQAIEEANVACAEIIPLFDGIGADLSRPAMLSVEGGAWFEDFEYSDFFYGGKAEKL